MCSGTFNEPFIMRISIFIEFQLNNEGKRIDFNGCLLQSCVNQEPDLTTKGQPTMIENISPGGISDSNAVKESPLDITKQQPISTIRLEHHKSREPAAAGNHVKRLDPSALVGCFETRRMAAFLESEQDTADTKSARAGVHSLPPARARGRVLGLSTDLNTESVSISDQTNQARCLDNDSIASHGNANLLERRTWHGYLKSYKYTSFWAKIPNW